MDLTGKTFGYLTVLGYTGRRVHSFKLYLCKCVCGIEREVSTNALNTGNTKSCGCKRTPIKLPTGEAGKRELFRSYKRDARRRNYEFALTLEEFSAAVTQACDYCGKHLGQVKYSRGRQDNPGYIASAFHYTGLDRIDSNKGYLLSNIVACCRTCNIAKHDMTVSEFLDWISRVHEHFRTQTSYRNEK